MIIKKHNFRAGMTLVELIITVLAAIVLLIGITGILAAGIKNYKTMYERTTSDVVRNAYEARRIFDRVVRQATIRHSVPQVGTSNELYVYYYSNPSDINIEYPDSYAWFYLSGDELHIRRGGIIPETWDIDPSVEPTDVPIAHNVSSVVFTVSGASVRMVLILDNESDPQNTNRLETLRMTVTTTGIRHNQ